jgi:hypothetical protein
MVLRLTSKMSHDASGRDSCGMATWISMLHFDGT